MWSIEMNRGVKRDGRVHLNHECRWLLKERGTCLPLHMIVSLIFLFFFLSTGAQRKYVLRSYRPSCAWDLLYSERTLSGAEFLLTSEYYSKRKRVSVVFDMTPYDLCNIDIYIYMYIYRRVRKEGRVGGLKGVEVASVAARVGSRGRAPLQSNCVYPFVTLRGEYNNRSNTNKKIPLFWV